MFVPAGEVSYQILSAPAQLNYEFIPAGQIVTNYDVELEKAAAIQPAKPAKEKEKGKDKDKG